MTDKINLISYCGLFCAECSKLKKGKCPGCEGYEKATWCKTRTCCINNGYKSCADCQHFDDISDCKKFNNFISKTIEFFTKTSRLKNMKFIKEHGYKAFAEEMTNQKLMSMKK